MRRTPLQRSRTRIRPVSRKRAALRIAARREDAVKVLDLFCSAGGSAMGLHRAMPDADITGVDINPQPHYPFKFIQADAMTFDLSGFDFVWASPPCQAYSVTSTIHPENVYPDLIAPTRSMLEKSGKPYIIENVVNAPLRTTVELCGVMFGLKTFRHRRFESNIMLLAPKHSHPKGSTTNMRRGDRGQSSHKNGATHITVAGNNFNTQDGAAALGIDWMTHRELAQAIPPAYSLYLGLQVMQFLRPTPGVACGDDAL